MQFSTPSSFVVIATSPTNEKTDAGEGQDTERAHFRQKKIERNLLEIHPEQYCEHLIVSTVSCIHILDWPAMKQIDISILF